MLQCVSYAMPVSPFLSKPHFQIGYQLASCLSKVSANSLILDAGDPSKGDPESAIERRALNPSFAPPKTETAFADAMPFLLANEVSFDIVYHTQRSIFFL